MNIKQLYKREMRLFFFVARYRYVEENADEQVTVTELTKKMDDYLKETG